MEKKGISPLIATILLIGLTIIIIALVILWGRSFIEERAEKSEALAQGELNCQRVKFTITEAYQQGNVLHVALQNKVNVKIDGFIFRVKGANGNIPAIEQNFILDDLETREVDVDISGADIGGAVETVDVIPRLKVGAGTFVPCSGQHIESRMTL